MGTRGTSVASQAPAPGMAPARPPISQTSTAMLRGWRPCFVYMARLDRLECSGGLVLPDLARVDAVAGRGGNTGADIVDPAGWCASMERQGYRRVPDDLDFSCWGASRAGCASGCTYRDWYATDRVAGLWSEAWQRPKILGQITRWTIDHEGARSFQGAVLTWLLHGSSLDNDLIETACAPVIEIARAYLSRATTHADIALRLRAVVAQLPPDRIPPDLAPFVMSKET